MNSLDNEYVIKILCIIFIHFKAYIFSGIPQIIWEEPASLHILECNKYPLSVRKWELFHCPAPMLELCILPSKPWLCPWLDHQQNSTIPDFQLSAQGACWRRRYGLISDGALLRLHHFQDHSSTAWVPGWLAVLNPKTNVMEGREGACSNTQQRAYIELNLLFSASLVLPIIKGNSCQTFCKELVLDRTKCGEFVLSSWSFSIS